MQIGLDLDSVFPRIEYPVYDFLAAVGYHEPVSTTEVVDEVGCSYETAFKRLQRLSQINILGSERVGNTHHWRTNIISPADTDINSTHSDERIAVLVHDTVRGIAQSIVEANNLNEAIPPNMADWLAERGMDVPEHSGNILARAAVFDHLLRESLYALYRPEHKDLRQINPEDNVDELCRQAQELTDSAGFDSITPATLCDGLNKGERRILLATRHALVQVENPASVLSVVYENLIPHEVRRDLGQFATPEHVSEFLSFWAIDDATDSVLDPGIGSGMLSAAAIRRKKQLGANSPLKDLHGNDIDFLSVSMSAFSLKLIDGSGSPSLTSKNFLQISPYEWNLEERVPDKTVDAVISNPPYSRSQALSSENKELANKIVTNETDINFHGKSPLYVYFLVHAIQFVRDGGRLAFVIPSGFMETEFGVPLKQYLLDRCTVDAVVQLTGETDIFNGVRTTPSLILLTKSTHKKDHETTFLNLTEWPTEVSVEDMVFDDTQLQEQEYGYKVSIAQSILSASENWKHYFTPTDVDELAGVSEFRNIAEIKRGIATGANSYFCLTEEEIAEYELSEKYLKKIIKNASDIPGYVINKEDWERWRDEGRPVYLLYCYDSTGEKITESQGESLEDYLRRGEEASVDEGTLCSGRNPWYCVDKREAAPILAKYMSRTGSQFIYNKTGVRTLNTFHNVIPVFKDREDYVLALCAYLNSNIVRREVSKNSRSYSGLEKIEVSQLKRTPVIDPRNISQGRVDTLGALFKELEKAERSGDDIERTREAIDSIVEDILGRSVG